MSSVKDVSGTYIGYKVEVEICALRVEISYGKGEHGNHILPTSETFEKENEHIGECS